MFPDSTKVTTSNNSQGRSQKQGDIKFSSEKYVGEGYLLPTVKMSAMLFSELKLVTDILFMQQPTEKPLKVYLFMILTDGKSTRRHVFPELITSRMELILVP